jgi:hypothetical protein
MKPRKNTLSLTLRVSPDLLAMADEIAALSAPVTPKRNQVLVQALSRGLHAMLPRAIDGAP